MCLCICVGEYVCRLVLFYDPVFWTKLIIILIILMLKSLPWSVSNGVLHGGYVEVIGPLYISAGINLQMPVCKSYVGLLFCCEEITLYDILHGRYDALKLSHFCVFNSSCTRAHPLLFVPPQSTINSFRYLFFCERCLFVEYCTIHCIDP